MSVFLVRYSDTDQKHAPRASIFYGGGNPAGPLYFGPMKMLTWCNDERRVIQSSHSCGCMEVGRMNSSMYIAEIGRMTIIFICYFMFS